MPAQIRREEWMPRANDGVDPDPQELRIRFVCGVLAGVIIGAFATFETGVESGAVAVALAAGASVASALLARHFGDRYWYWWLR
jgi:hypothetical protein